MINRLIIMFIPSGIVLGLLAAYMISQGVSIPKCIAALAVVALLMSIVMVRVAQDTYDDIFEEDDDDTNKS